MRYVDIDFAIPIALLVASIVGVMLVRVAAARGERLARARTERLIEEHGGAAHYRDGMRDSGRASTPFGNEGDGGSAAGASPAGEDAGGA
ncbi:MAG TPA: hypothetical protein VIL20_03860 [Sandaracinaceae bacterium]